MHAHNLGGKEAEKEQEEEKKGLVDQEKKSMPSCMSILTGGQKFRGEWKVNPGDDSKMYWAATEALYKENHGGCTWYKFWMMLVLALTAIFVKCMLTNVIFNRLQGIMGKEKVEHDQITDFSEGQAFPTQGGMQLPFWF